MTEFSKRLTSLREGKGWSKTLVAKQIGLSSMQTYANWEYGRTEPDLEMVNKLASVFNVTTDYLLNGNKNKVTETVNLDKAIDAAMSYEGQPVTDHDRKVMKKLWRAYLSSKEQ
ncbi:helix-turn-helix domain-containing protein [Limosilactobacillus sp.]|uniref:helix-turn-helix domain-containing protein n=1 Tax=Limosilactobacillus sp. TaxID=2773925 RepID=UPI003EFC74A0